jgi:hypothetical protein
MVRASVRRKVTVIRFRSTPDHTVVPQYDPAPPVSAAPHESRLLLLDWSGLSDDCIWADYGTRDGIWTSLGRAYARVAVLHHRRWNRQAAYIGALLRLAGAVVRSFSSRERQQAIHWLESSNSRRS